MLLLHCIVGFLLTFLFVEWWPAAKYCVWHSSGAHVRGVWVQVWVTSDSFGVCFEQPPAKPIPLFGSLTPSSDQSPGARHPSPDYLYSGTARHAPLAAARPVTVRGGRCDGRCGCPPGRHARRHDAVTRGGYFERPVRAGGGSSRRAGRVFGADTPALRAAPVVPVLCSGPCRDAAFWHRRRSAGSGNVLFQRPAGGRACVGVCLLSSPPQGE